MEQFDCHSPADLRAAIARRRIPLFKLAAVVGLHPTTLGQMLNERKPLTQTVAERLTEALNEK
jgi:plasmid maintenance system antidote protein VapI